MELLSSSQWGCLDPEPETTAHKLAFVAAKYIIHHSLAHRCKAVCFTLRLDLELPCSDRFTGSRGVNR